MTLMGQVFFPHVGHEDQTQAVRLGSLCFCPPGLFSWPR